MGLATTSEHTSPSAHSRGLLRDLARSFEKSGTRKSSENGRQEEPLKTPPLRLRDPGSMRLTDALQWGSSAPGLLYPRNTVLLIPGQEVFHRPLPSSPLYSTVLKDQSFQLPSPTAFPLVPVLSN